MNGRYIIFALARWEGYTHIGKYPNWKRLHEEPSFGYAAIAPGTDTVVSLPDYLESHDAIQRCLDKLNRTEINEWVHYLMKVCVRDESNVFLPLPAQKAEALATYLKENNR